MATRKYTVCFLTPAFLGDADQNGRWRTPPFKHLLREWWRVAYFSHADKFSLDQMRREEGLLFGNAWLSRRVGSRVVTDHCGSLVRLRLDCCEGDSVSTWQQGTMRGVAPMRADISTSYAWFGLVNRGQGLPDRTAIKANSARESTRVLRMAVPENHTDTLDLVMRLIAAFGTLGARSRGGWGSVHVDGIKELSGQEISRFSQPLADCLQRDWAATLVCDDESGKSWVWQQTFDELNWNEVMSELATLRKEVRTALKADIDMRPALGFAGNGRMPSPLRWKIVNANGSLAIRIFAMPHHFPQDAGKRMSEQQLERAWKIVRDLLDEKMDRYCVTESLRIS